MGRVKAAVAVYPSGPQGLFRRRPPLGRYPHPPRWWSSTQVSPSAVDLQSKRAVAGEEGEHVVREIHSPSECPPFPSLPKGREGDVGSAVLREMSAVRMFHPSSKMARTCSKKHIHLRREPM